MDSRTGVEGVKIWDKIIDTYTPTHRNTHSSVYRVAPATKNNFSSWFGVWQKLDFAEGNMLIKN